MASDINKLDVVMFSILSNTRTGVDTFIETSRQWIEKEGCKVHLIYIVDVKYGLPKVKKRNGNIRAELPMPENMPALLILRSELNIGHLIEVILNLKMN